ncbi:peptidoglycan editing factor PgeF [Porticoccaceae bacterium LTM1]|nr:peptidoglycan editing factor PgeF [Porticoccaceae bacterium LTM1]
MKLLTPDWPAPAEVKAVLTTRLGGYSEAPWDSFNLGLRTGDDQEHMASNRALLNDATGLGQSPQWLHQVHGKTVVEASADGVEREADAAVSRTPGLAAAVLTADCLPVLFCAENGSVVAAAHAGWRGLAGGVLRNTVDAMGVEPGQILAYLGPAISQTHFEVGPEVKAAFQANAINSGHGKEIDAGFIAGKGDRLQADIYALAKAELNAIGVNAVYGGNYCTYSQPDLFYSYRRDGVTGRMASLIWIE